LTTRNCGAPHRPGSFAGLYGFTANAGDSISVVMSSAALRGYVILDSSATGTGPPQAQSDNLRYQLLRSAGTYVVEATSAGAGETGVYTLSVTGPRVPNRPDSLVQLRGDTTAAVPVGGAVEQPAIVLRGVMSDPDAADTLRLQVELEPVGTPFTGTPTGTSGWIPNGGRALVSMGGLPDNTTFHWQARTLDQTGRAGAWLAFGGNPQTADFSTAVPQPPGAPTTLGQFQSDGSTSIPAGGTAFTRSVVFTATVADPDPGDRLHLEVEVEPVGTPFSGTPNGSGPAVANGATATGTGE